MPKSTQSYLDVAEIKQDVVVLKDGSLRAVVLVASHNFALKSEDEQNALVYAYVTMLNQLENPIQMLIQSRKMNIDEYINELEDRVRTQTNELLKIQTQDYMDFIQEIITLGNIMSKKFFVIIPYSPAGTTRQGFFKRMSGVFTPTRVIRLREKQFAKYKESLEKKVSNVISGLNNVNLSPARLDTQSLIELFYTTYNPEVAEIQKLGDIGNLQVES